VVAVSTLAPLVVPKLVAVPASTMAPPAVLRPAEVVAHKMFVQALLLLPDLASKVYRHHHRSC